MVDSTAKELPWWKRTVVYQIYPRSFMDSSGNGIGDIPGIISKLDYLKDLGIETIWFSPFYTSPQEDHGYDISDYRNIAPEYGTLQDCERLIKGLHDREMHIVLDMVLNHTSDQHPWFLESRSSRDNPKRDWYIWRDGKKPGGKKPPSNWHSFVGGLGWYYDAQTDQWYWAQFLPFQPDLNYRNPEVKEEMFNTVRFWLDKGVDGFRLDIINAIYESETLEDNPFAFALLPSEDSMKGYFQNHVHTINHPDNYQFVKELRAVMDEYADPERFLVGEVDAPLDVLKQYCGEVVDGQRTDGLHLTFLFKSLKTPLEGNVFRDLTASYEDYFLAPYLPTWVFSNHDQVRRITRLGNSPEKARLNAMLQLTLRGVPFIYYGEEIGMANTRIPLKQGQDPIAQKFRWLPQPLADFITRGGSFSLNRDGCRTPMQWDSSTNAGFSAAGANPWLPIGQGYLTANVETQSKDPDSILACYRGLLHIRRARPSLHSGDLELLRDKDDPEGLLRYRRTYGGQTTVVFANLSSRRVEVSGLGTPESLLFSTVPRTVLREGGTLALAPYQGVIVDAPR